MDCIARKLISVIDSLTPVELCVCVSSSGFTIDVIFNFVNNNNFCGSAIMQFDFAFYGMSD